jgi:predicted branched-subunit amino acid permease
LAYILVDESFGLTLRAHGSGVDDVVAYKTAADLVLYSGWMVGTVIGAWFGSSIDPEALGIGVFFPLLFLGLAAPLVRTQRDLVVAVVAVAATLIATITLPEAWQLTAAATVAALIGAGLGE